MKKFGLKIKIIRNARKITQRKLADLTGLSQGTISKIELGKSNPDIEIVNILAINLKVRLTDLVKVDKIDL